MIRQTFPLYDLMLGKVGGEMFGESGWIKTGEKSLTNEYINQEILIWMAFNQFGESQTVCKIRRQPLQPPPHPQLYGIRLFSLIASQFDTRFDLYKNICLARDTELINQQGNVNLTKKV